jgi:hypothetical protein
MGKSSTHTSCPFDLILMDNTMPGTMTMIDSGSSDE